MLIPISTLNLDIKECKTHYFNNKITEIRNFDINICVKKQYNKKNIKINIFNS